MELTELRHLSDAVYFTTRETNYFYSTTVYKTRVVRYYDKITSKTIKIM